MINLSSAMGGQFAWSAAEMTAEIQRLGPNPLRSKNGQAQMEEQKSEIPDPAPYPADTKGDRNTP
jgi:hypothetical protein